MKHIIRRILSEQYNSDYLEKVSSRLQPPYFQMMIEHFNVTDQGDQLEVLKYIYGNDISIQRFFGEKNIYGSKGNIIYQETRSGVWSKFEYNSNGDQLYHENSDGYWCKREFDENSNVLSLIKSDGFWYRYEYDSSGKEKYYEDSHGHIIINGELQ